MKLCKDDESHKGQGDRQGIAVQISPLLYLWVVYQPPWLFEVPPVDTIIPWKPII